MSVPIEMNSDALLLQIGSQEILFISIGFLFIVFLTCLALLRTGMSRTLPSSDAKRSQSSSMPVGETKGMPAEFPSKAEEEDFTSLSVRMSEVMSETIDVERRSPVFSRDSVASPGVGAVLERYASLIFWERMALNEEYNLVVSLHEKDIKVQAIDSSGVVDFESRYEIPEKGQVRIIPVCSKCIISPSNRDVTVTELQRETRAEFKIRPLETGPAQLVIEFHFVDEHKMAQLLGTEMVNVTIQQKPYELKVGGLVLRVSRKIPPLASFMGSFFTFISFVLSQMGLSLSAGVAVSAVTVGSGVGGVALLGYGALLFLKSVKPLMSIVPIKLHL